MSSLVILVDHASPTEALPKYLTERGYTCVNVWSSLAAYESQFRIPNYTYVVESYVFAGFDHLKSKIAGRHVAIVIAGSDVGLNLADVLGAEFGVLQNGMTAVRADRYLTSLFLHEPCTITDSDALDTIVVKPRKSAGGYEGVTVQSHGKIPTGMFAQPFYKNDQEFGVDIVSKNGAHHITSIWRYIKNLNSIGNQRYELMDWDHEAALMERLVEFCQRALDSLKYRIGACHIELMLVDDEIRLIECNFRPHGHLDDATMLKALNGRSQTAELCKALLDNVEFDNAYRYTVKSLVHRILITVPAPRLSSSFKWNELSKLISIGRVYRMHHPNEIVPANMFAWRHLLANVLIIGKSKAYLIAEENRIRNILS